MLQFLEQFSGLFGLLFFVATIFKYSGSTISPNLSSIIVGVIQIVGCYCSTLLVDRAGRKILISTSAFGISIGMFVFALYSYLHTQGYDLTYFNWVPLASFSFTLWIANLGVLSLPFLVTSELIITLPNVSSFPFATEPLIIVIYFPDKAPHLHFLPLPLMGLRVHHFEIFGSGDCADWYERVDVNFFLQLSHRRAVCCRLYAGNEGKKLPWNFSHAREVRKLALSSMLPHTTSPNCGEK